MRARQDPSLVARVVRRMPMSYALGPDAEQDRPGHVRAASGIAWVGERVVVVQDDANFLASVDPLTGMAVATPLPAGRQGKRLFDDSRGNKKFKLDIETCAVVHGQSGALVLALGSGSAAGRERVAVVRAHEVAATSDAGSCASLVMVDATSLYERMRERTEFAGSELNVEGAVAIPGNRLRLLQRGNGASSGGLGPVDATTEVRIDALLDYLEDPAHHPPPKLADVCQWDLGDIGGARLTFTDGTWWHDRMLYVAAAEQSEDAVSDGPVAGACVGAIGPSGDARWAALVTSEGEPFLAKPEGIAPGSEDGTVLLVVDRDDPDIPAELCVARLEGPWR